MLSLFSHSTNTVPAPTPGKARPTLQQTLCFRCTGQSPNSIPYSALPITTPLCLKACLSNSPIFLLDYNPAIWLQCLSPLGRYYSYWRFIYHFMSLFQEREEITGCFEYEAPAHRASRNGRPAPRGTAKRCLSLTQ